MNQILGGQINQMVPIGAEKRSDARYFLHFLIEVA